MKHASSSRRDPARHLLAWLGLEITPLFPSSATIPTFERYLTRASAIRIKRRCHSYSFFLFVFVLKVCIHQGGAWAFILNKSVYYSSLGGFVHVMHPLYGTWRDGSVILSHLQRLPFVAKQKVSLLSFKKFTENFKWWQTLKYCVVSL